MRALMLHRLPPCRRLPPPPRLSRPRALMGGAGRWRSTAPGALVRTPAGRGPGAAIRPPPIPQPAMTWRAQQGMRAGRAGARGFRPALRLRPPPVLLPPLRRLVPGGSGGRAPVASGPRCPPNPRGLVAPSAASGSLRGLLALGLAPCAPWPGLGSPCAAFFLGSSRSWGRLGAAEPRLFTRRRPHERFQNTGPGGIWDFITLRWLSSRWGLTAALSA